MIIKCNGEKERNFSHKTSFIIFHTIQILLIVSELCGIPLEQKRVVRNALNEIEMVFSNDFHLLRLFLFI